MNDTDDMTIAENDVAELPPAFVPDPDGEAGPERDADSPGWAYSLSTDPVGRGEAAEATERLVASYLEAVVPSTEVQEHLAAAVSALTVALIPVLGSASDKVVVRIGGRATPGHANVPGPDESITIMVSVVDMPDAPEAVEDASEPMQIEGGTYSLVE